MSGTPTRRPERDFMLNIVLAIGVVVLLVGLLVGSLPN
ncbi:MAG: hypothetical protein USCAAHI_03072 [Beijerinckiaceae bacterium]|nr:MAG: hypothetical protein USCAAHI_03072 [Beijerinckiaceae bacterium]